MNILIIGSVPPKYGGKGYGGVATHIEGLISSLIKSNHNVSIWYHYPNKDKKYPNLKIVGNSFWSYLISFFYGLFELLTYRKKKYLSLKQHFLLSFQKFALKRILKSNSFDCIHIHSIHNTSGIAIQDLKKLDCPFIYTDHGFWQNNKSMIHGCDTFIKLKNNISNCSSVIYISDFAKSKHDEIDFGQIDKLVKIQNPLTVPPLIEKSKHRSKKKRIFFNGLTESLKIKQLDVLLSAIQNDDILKSRVEVYAICNTEGEKYVNANLFDFSINVYSAMNWNSVVEIYKKCDIFVLPSKSESFGLVYLEALSFGLPIIGFKNVFSEFETTINEYIGEPFDSNNETEIDLGRKIQIVLDANFNREKVYSSLKLNYSWDNNLNKFVSLYQDAKVKHGNSISNN